MSPPRMASTCSPSCILRSRRFACDIAGRKASSRHISAVLLCMSHILESNQPSRLRTWWIEDVMCLPLRLFDCFGFSTPSILFVVDGLCVLEFVGFLLWTGFGAIIGLEGCEARRRVVGEGMMIVSIETWRPLQR